MSSLSRNALAVTGTTLAGEIGRLLLSLNYARCNVDAAISWIQSRGTLTACPVIDREDWAAVNDLVARHTGDAEADPAAWPAWVDDYVWEPFEPDTADRLWVASEGAVNLFDEDVDSRADEAAALALLCEGLTPDDVAPVRGGSPDERPIKVRGVRSRVCRDWTDADQARHQGCV